MNDPRGAMVSGERPFPGLRAFDFDDQRFYFGRQDQIYALYAMLERGRFIAVVGGSGSGKSSLVRAGLLPLLADETRDAGGKSWRWAQMRPGSAPIANLAEALAGMHGDGAPSATDAHEILRSKIGVALQGSSF